MVGAVIASSLLVVVSGRRPARGARAGRGDGLASGAWHSRRSAVLIQSLGDFGFHGEGTPYLYILVIALCLRRAADADASPVGRSGAARGRSSRAAG